MVFLIISILCSVAVSILLKISRSKNMNIEQAIGINYIVAIVLCMVVLQPDISHWQSYLPSWWIFIALGILLPTIFIVMGKAVQQAGIVKSDAAQRLSLFLPIVASFLIFGEQLTHNKIIGIVLAFVALICLLWKHDTKAKKGGSVMSHIILLIGVWLGYGVIDILFKQIAKSGTVFSGNLLIAFCLAAILMFGYLFYKGGRWSFVNILGGLILGCLNFANIWTYIRAHQVMHSNPTLVFAGMNIGVIVLGTLVGSFIFKEKINTINAAGIAIAIVAILCLFYWQVMAKVIGV